jgi:hypothetical protein
MSVLGRRPAAGATRSQRRRRLFVALLASPFLGGCDQPFEPFQEDTQGPFSMFGYLDLAADTQWIRVTSVRQNLIADPAPIDAVVTLESLESGRRVTLKDSVFEFIDVDLQNVAYAHNFWTTEQLERGVTYRLEAARSDGAKTTALVEMPAEAEVSVTYFEGPVGAREGGPFRNPLRIHVRGEHLLYADAVYMVRDLEQTPRRDSLVIPQFPILTDPGGFEFASPPTLRRNDVLDQGRVEARIAVATSEWPFQPGLSPTEAALPGSGPSNVENGFGFVGGLAMWTFPRPSCDPKEARPDGSPVCGHVVGGSSGSVVGRVLDTCDRLLSLRTIRLTERFPGGGTAVFEWKTGLDGRYEFEGLEPGADLVLEVQGAPGPVRVSALSPGERQVVPDVLVPTPCSPGAASLPPG